MQVFRCYGSRSAATEKYSLKLFTCKLGQSVVKGMQKAYQYTLFSSLKRTTKMGATCN